MPTHRTAGGPQGLRAALDLISATWLAERPHATFTVGTLEWQMASGPPEADWTERIHLWEDGDEVVAAFWFPPNGTADGLVRADLRHGSIEAETVAIHERQAARDGADALARFAIDGDADDAAFLQAAGFRPTDDSFTQWHQRLDAPPPTPTLPEGYRVRTLAGPEELAARVEVHRSAFAPSKMTLERYGRVVQQPHYSGDRDVVVEAPDGSFASFTLAWFDPAAKVGEFEPVGTHADHRRLGLALAANRHGLRLLYDAGADDVIVFSGTDNAASQALYRAAGFSPLAVHRRWARPTRPT